MGTEPPDHMLFLALARGWTPEPGSMHFLSNLDQITYLCSPFAQ